MKNKTCVTLVMFICKFFYFYFPSFGVHSQLSLSWLGILGWSNCFNNIWYLPWHSLWRFINDSSSPWLPVVLFKSFMIFLRTLMSVNNSLWNSKSVASGPHSHRSYKLHTSSVKRSVFVLITNLSFIHRHGLTLQISVQS